MGTIDNLPSKGASFLVACVLALGAAAAGTAKSAVEIEQLLAKGEVDEAIRAGRTAVEENPTDPDLRMVLARALADRARSVRRTIDTDLLRGSGKPEIVYDREVLEDALGHVREAIRLAPGREDLRFGECYLLTDAGDIEGAAAAIRRAMEAIEGDAGNAATLASYGSERINRGDIRGGRILLGVVASGYPRNARVQAMYGAALARDGRRDEALASLDRAGALAPENLDVQRRRAVVCMLLREFSRARESFDAAFAISGEEQDRFGAAAATFGFDRAAAAAAFRKLAEPAVSADAAKIAKAFLSALAGFREGRFELARLLLREDHPLLALPVAHTLQIDNPEDRAAIRLVDTIYQVMDFPVHEPSAGGS